MCTKSISNQCSYFSRDLYFRIRISRVSNILISKRQNKNKLCAYSTLIFIFIIMYVIIINYLTYDIYKLKNLEKIIYIHLESIYF